MLGELWPLDDVLLLKRAAAVQLQLVDLLWQCRDRIARSPPLFFKGKTRLHVFIMSTNLKHF